MAPVVDIVDVTEEGLGSGLSTQGDQFVESCLDKIFDAVDQSPEMFMRCCLEYVENKTRLLSQRGCEQNMVRLMEAVRLGSGRDSENQGNDEDTDRHGTDDDLCETIESAHEKRVKNRGLSSPSSSSSLDNNHLHPQGPGNGAVHPTYSWTQTLAEVSIIVPVPSDVAPIKGKDCQVTIQRQYIRVGVAHQEAILDGPLFAPVRVDDCMWNLVDSNTIEVSLTKINSMEWWKCVVQGEPEIDTTKIEPEPSGLHDVDPEMRSTVEKMMYDQQQQALRQNASNGYADSTDDKKEAIQKFIEAHPELDFSEAAIDLS